MKKNLKALLLLAGLAPTAPSFAFVNLDFENAAFEFTHEEGFPDRERYLEWAPAVPGWSNNLGYDAIYRSTSHLGLTPFYVLVDSEPPYWDWPLEGRFSLALKSGNAYYGEGDEMGPWVDAAIMQEGTIPVDTRALRLLASDGLKIEFNDRNVPLYALGGKAWAADFTAFAGQRGRLEIINPWQTHRVVILDAVEFSAQPVPEPETYALFGMSLAGVIAARRMRARRG